MGVILIHTTTPTFHLIYPTILLPQSLFKPLIPNIPPVLFSYHMNYTIPSLKTTSSPSYLPVLASWFLQILHIKLYKYSLSYEVIWNFENHWKISLKCSFIYMFFKPVFFSIKREILPLVKSLCQDVEYEVRSCMCRQLENIAQGIG